MSTELRILILEDVATDAELVERELRCAGIAFASRLVATRDEFRRALREFAPDLILADYSLPGFDGIEALSIAQEQCPAVPFVFASGAIGEERAIETLKSGATDYVLKQRMSRLVPSVRRALCEAAERASRQRAEEALRRSEARHRALLQINNAIVSTLSREALFEAIARALRQVLTFDRASLTLPDPAKNASTVHALAGTVPILPVGTEVPHQGTRTGWVLEHKQPVRIRDLRDEPPVGLLGRLAEAGIRSALIVPLLASQRAIGTLNVSSMTPDQYADEDAEFLTEVGTQVALAVENMLAYEEIARLKALLEQENLYLQEEIKTQHTPEEIVGESAAIRKILKDVETVAPTDATVLITGETGTGKERVARAVHALGARRQRAMVKVNCAALPPTLIESELFGHERGAFTGAVSRKLGRFELADKGTIFLDEIGDLPMDLQAKLLRVLQEGEFERVGGAHTIKVDVRVIAATNQDLQKAIESGTFRPDLYYRLNVFPIEVPPLRERREDIPLLVRHLAAKYCTKLAKRIDTIPQATMNTLTAYPWPGNVRELENVIERAVILNRGSRLQIDERPLRPRATPSGAAGVTLQEVERQHIVDVLETTGWRVSGDRGAAKLLGLRPTTLEARMQRLGIRRPSSKFVH